MKGGEITDISNKMEFLNKKIVTSYTKTWHRTVKKIVTIYVKLLENVLFVGKNIM